MHGGSLPIANTDAVHQGSTSFWSLMQPLLENYFQGLVVQFHKHLSLKHLFSLDCRQLPTALSQSGHNGSSHLLVPDSHRQQADPFKSKTAPAPLSDASHCKVMVSVESKFLRTGTFVMSSFTFWTVLSCTSVQNHSISNRVSLRSGSNASLGQGKILLR